MRKIIKLAPYTDGIFIIIVILKTGFPVFKICNVVLVIKGGGRRKIKSKNINRRRIFKLIYKFVWENCTQYLSRQGGIL
jgi:hypothetical protein